MSEPLDRRFTAKLRKSENKGGWTYVIMSDSAAFFGTRGLVKVCGTITANRLRVRSWRSATAPTNCP